MNGHVGKKRSPPFRREILTASFHRGFTLSDEYDRL